MRFASAFLFIAVWFAPALSAVPGPPPPLPWFTEHIQLGAVDLPAGVSVEVVPISQPYRAADSIELRNTSSTRLYVLGQSSTDPRSAGISVKLPAGIGPLNVIADGKAYFWVERGQYGENAYFGWVRERAPSSDSVRLDCEGNRIVSDAGTVLGLKPLNPYDGDRPSTVAIPGPQDASLPLLYGTQDLKIPLTISYSLNEDYHKYQTSLIPDYIGPIELLSCLIIAVVVGAAFYWIIDAPRRRA